VRSGSVKRVASGVGEVRSPFSSSISISVRWEHDRLFTSSLTFSEIVGRAAAVVRCGSELNQVWTNLIDNVIDAMNGQGKLEIRTQREHKDVLVEIADNGRGVPSN